MSNGTSILHQIESGDPSAEDQLLPFVYDELRKLAAAKLAHEKPRQTLQATALVHEAYLRLVGSRDGEPSWSRRRHFFGAAAEAMRRILLNRARDKGRLKRGGQRHPVSLELVELAVGTPHEDLLALDESIEQLATENPECASVVKLRFLAGSRSKRPQQPSESPPDPIRSPRGPVSLRRDLFIVGGPASRSIPWSNYGTVILRRVASSGGSNVVATIPHMYSY